mmetsp:Transcript_54142/g.97543  ORF Transcript_54142/g.97543 Transcript_54142/m.97543 type:complete len:489 (+) Transcript_54142:29-1495(+)
MASLRRLDGQVRVCHSSDVRGPGHSQDFGGMLQDWSLHAVRADSERRAEALKRQRAGLWLPGEQSAALAAEAAERLHEEREQRTTAARLEESLAVQLKERRQEFLRKQADVQLACASSPELRDERRRHLAVQAARRQELQLLQRELEEEQARQEQDGQASAAEVESWHNAQMAITREAALRSEGARLRQELLAQASEARTTRAATRTEECRQDRVLVDAAASRVREEDERDLTRRRQLQTEVREALDRLLHQRDHQREEDARRQREAQLRAEAEQREQSQLAQRLAGERRAAEEARGLVLERLAQDLAGRAEQGLRLEELRQAIREEELEADRRREEEESLRKRFEARAAALEAAEDNLRLLDERRRADEASEQRWRRDFVDRLAEEERLDQLSQQRRRMRLLAHQREAERLSEQRRAAVEAEFQHQREELLKTRQEEAQRAQIVAEERQRLLRLHGLGGGLAGLTVAEGNGLADTSAFAPPGRGARR